MRTNAKCSRIVKEKRLIIRIRAKEIEKNILRITYTKFLQMEYKTYIKKSEEFKSSRLCHRSSLLNRYSFHHHYRGILEATEWFRKILYKIVDRQDKSASP